MLIAITGSNGNVGKRVALHALRAGHTVRGIDHAPPVDSDDADARFVREHARFAFVAADLREYGAARDALRGADAVAQLAAFPNPGDGVSQTHNSNVVISWNVLRSCAELGITRVALASSVNAIGLVFNQTRVFDYLPIDEAHPCRPDEAYGVSKLVLETQADAMARRYPTMRIASLRLGWSIPTRAFATRRGGDRAKDLWGYVQEDAAADAFLRALGDLPAWHAGHEVFFVVASQPTAPPEDSFATLHARAYPDVPVKPGEWTGFFDCDKARRILGWEHPNDG